MLTCCQLCLGDSFTRRQNFQFEWHLTNIYAIYKDVTRRYIFFWKTFTKVSVRTLNMQQLNPEKIVSKLIITFSQKTLHKLKRFDSANTLKHWVQAAVYVIEGKMFPALQFLFHLQWNYWLPSGWPLLSLWPINRSPFKTCRENTELNICSDLKLHSLTIQMKDASCVPQTCDAIFFCSTPQCVITLSRLRKMISK